MSEQPQQFIEPAGPEVFERLRGLIDSVKAGDPLAPVTIVGPSVYANISMRHRLALSGSANTRFLIFSRLSELLGAPALASKNRRPLTRILESAAVKAVSIEARGVLEAVGDHPSTPASLINTFRQLRHATPAALDRLEERGELRREIVRLYRLFRERTSSFYDREDLAEAAAESIASGEPSGLEDLGVIVFFMPLEVTPAGRKLIQALAEKNRCALVLGLTGDAEADVPTISLSEGLSTSLGAARLAEPGSAVYDHELLIAPDPQQEVRWVLRRLLGLANQGMPFHRMAVLYRTDEPYAALISEEMDLAFGKIPASGPGPTSLAQSSVGRALSGLLRLAEGEFARDAVMAWLTGGPILSPESGFGPINASQWDAISKKAEVVKGLDQWNVRLRRYADDRLRLARRSEELGEVSEAHRNTMEQEAQSAMRLRDFVSKLGSDAVPPADGSSWREYCDWAKERFNDYVHPDEQAPTSELDAHERVLSIIDELRGVDELRDGATLSDFSLAVEEAMRGSRHHAGTTGQGVFVAPLRAAAGMDFDVVHILGMVEGVMPPRIESDPLLPEDDRLAAGGTSAGIPLQQARRGEEVRAYLLALATAPVRVLSYPTADIAAQRINFPSRWFVEAASQLEGAPLYASGLSGLGSRPWLTTITSVEQGLISTVEETEVDSNEFVLNRLLDWKRSGRSLPDHPLAAGRELEEAFKLIRQRRTSDLTAWDGDVSAIARGSEYSDRVNKPVYSPTSLERWAVCPYRYFLGDVLGISDIEEPEDAYAISPLEKGSLVHEILERFIRDKIESDSLSRPDEAWGEQHAKALRGVADELFRVAEERGVTGKSLLWRIEKANIISDLNDFLEEDSRYRAEMGVTTKMVEARFGMSSDSWGEATLELDSGEVLKFRGIIDRVDVDATGTRVVVLDYKTGTSRGYANIEKDPVDGGRRLQLPIYSIAALQALGAESDVRAAYWFTSGAERATLIPSDLSSFEEAQDSFKAAVSTITAGLRSGLFPANPGDRGNNGFVNCTHCDFDSLCLSRRDYIWGRKKHDQRLLPYLRLSEGGE